MDGRGGADGDALRFASLRLLCFVFLFGLGTSAGRNDGAHSYLVDPASSHMLVSKIKPCMSKYKRLYSETANGSLYQL